MEKGYLCAPLVEIEINTAITEKEVEDQRYGENRNQNAHVSQQPCHRVSVQRMKLGQ